MFWGSSEALDLISEYMNIFKNKDKNREQIQDNQNANEDGNKKQFKKEINILLFGANDPRHLIKTMAKINTHSFLGVTPALNFYLVDGCVEIIARNLLLLSIALESPDILNLRSKVHLFMDIYGNSLIRASSHHYLQTKGKSLLKVVTDDACRRKLTPMINFDKMKYRERDGLENTFDFWRSKDNNVFKIQEHWNARVRKQLGTRYEYREGLFDWDLNMVLKERKGKQLCSQEYRYWRETGIAFTFPEYEYSQPNKTLVAGLVRNGDKVIHQGYVGDIQVGPFAAFGVNTPDENMLKSVYGENEYRSTDITERNLLELFHELETKTLYKHDVGLSKKYGAVRLHMGQCLTHYEFNIDNTKEYDKGWILTEGITINFLSSDDIFSLQDCSQQWLRFFNIVFVGYNYFTFLQDSFLNILNHQSLLIMETKLFSTARKEEVHNFKEKLLNYAKKNNLKNVVNYSTVNSDDFILKFKSSCH